MDPNSALVQLRTAASVWEDRRGNRTDCPEADLMRDAARALDDALTAGAALPVQWDPNRRAIETRRAQLSDAVRNMTDRLMVTIVAMVDAHHALCAAQYVQRGRVAVDELTRLHTRYVARRERQLRALDRLRTALADQRWR